MNAILLCEGETDQIILSYYFIKRFNYAYRKDLSKLLNVNSQAEHISLYVHDDDKLTIWAVGGNDLLIPALEKVFNINKTNAGKVYEKIVVIADRDSSLELENLWKELKKCMNKFGINDEFRSEEWISVNQNIDFNDTLSLEILGLGIPLETDGALETFLLNALGAKDDNKYLVCKSKEFVKDLLDNKKSFPDKYLSNRRLRIKAPLAVFFAITSPDRMFNEINEILKSIPWEEYEKIQKDFHLLNKLVVKETDT